MMKTKLILAVALLVVGCDVKPPTPISNEAMTEKATPVAGPPLEFKGLVIGQSTVADFLAKYPQKTKKGALPSLVARARDDTTVECWMARPRHLSQAASDAAYEACKKANVLPDEFLIGTYRISSIVASSPGAVGDGVMLMLKLERRQVVQAAVRSDGVEVQVQSFNDDLGFGAGD